MAFPNRSCVLRDGLAAIGSPRRFQSPLQTLDARDTRSTSRAARSVARTRGDARRPGNGIIRPFHRSPRPPSLAGCGSQAHPYARSASESARLEIARCGSAPDPPRWARPPGPRSRCARDHLPRAPFVIFFQTNQSFSVPVDRPPKPLSGSVLRDGPPGQARPSPPTQKRARDVDASAPREPRTAAFEMAAEYFAVPVDRPTLSGSAFFAKGHPRVSASPLPDEGRASRNPHEPRTRLFVVRRAPARTTARDETRDARRSYRSSVTSFGRRPSHSLDPREPRPSRRTSPRVGRGRGLHGVMRDLGSIAADVGVCLSLASLVRELTDYNPYALVIRPYEQVDPGLLHDERGRDRTTSRPGGLGPATFERWRTSPALLTCALARVFKNFRQVEGRAGVEGRREEVQDAPRRRGAGEEPVSASSDVLDRHGGGSARVLRTVPRLRL